jgi:hypothetical protein
MNSTTVRKPKPSWRHTGARYRPLQFTASVRNAALDGFRKGSLIRTDRYPEPAEWEIEARLSGGANRAEAFAEL